MKKMRRTWESKTALIFCAALAVLATSTGLQVKAQNRTDGSARGHQT